LDTAIGNCAFEDGVHSIVTPDLSSTITHDDGVSTGTSGGLIGIAIPCIDGTDGVICDSDNDFFMTDSASYLVDCTDENDTNDLLQSTTTYTGLAHSSNAGDIANGAGGQGSQSNPCLIPSINITKTVEPTVSKAGDNVTYSINVCNDGETFLANLTVTDTILGDLSGSYADSLDLNTCESNNFEYTILGGDPDPLINNATATANAALDSDGGGINSADDIIFDGVDDNDLISVSASDIAEVDQVHPSFTFEKDCAPDQVTLGQDIQFTIFFNNTGDVHLIANITDPTGGINQVDAVAPAANVTIVYNVTTSQTGTLNNTATAFVTLGGIANHLTNNFTQTAEARCEVAGEPGVDITKTVEPEVSKEGDSVTYNVTIFNTGDVPLENVTVTDTRAGDLSGNFSDTLVVNGSATFSYNFTIPGGAEDPFNNTATVEADGVGVDSAEAHVSANASALVDLVHPSFTFEKSCEPGTVNVGEDIQFTIVFTNTGDVDLIANITDALGGINQEDTVAPAANVTITFNVTTTEAGTVNNTASVHVTLGGIGADLPNFFDDTAQSSCEVAGLEGCTPGFWKANALNKGAVAWGPTGFVPGQRVDSVFTGMNPSLGDDTLLQALQYTGGSGLLGAEKILLRAAVAALLNSAHPDIDYPLTTAQVIAQVNAALATNDRTATLALATQLDGFNNLGCSIDQQGNPI